MSLALKNARNSARTISNKDNAGLKKATVGKMNATNDSKSKRTAEASPEGVPNRKRSVFGDITNAVVSINDSFNEKKDGEKRITRSRSGSTLKLSQELQPAQETRKSKRIIEKQAELQSSQVEDVDSSSVSEMQDSFDTAEESLTSTLELSSFNETKDKSSSFAERAFSCVRPPKVPEGVLDFDAEVANDPCSVPLYAQDIFRYLKERELKFIVPKYMDRQREVTKHMRAILVDWMAEVQESFELNHETLYLAIKLIDLYLSRERVPKNALQLVGSTALLIASKFDERSPPAVNDFLYICDDAYDRRQLLRMEIRMLKVVGFDLGAPLSYTFLRRYARCSKQSMELLTLARYILELSLMEYDLIDVPDSLVAAAALCLALQMSKLEAWNPTLEYFSSYQIDDLRDLVQRLNTMVANAKSKNLQTIVNKYSHKVFYCVAKMSPLDHSTMNC